MNLHQLSVFRAILETGSFSKAALELRIAQSAVSYHVKMLEDEIGHPLFTRMKGRAHPTEKGQQLWKHAERIFATVAEAERDMRLPTESPWSELHFGLGVSSLTPQLPHLLKHLREIYPADHVPPRDGQHAANHRTPAGTASGYRSSELAGV